MSESKGGAIELINPGEEKEGDVVTTSDFIFRKIGSPIPLKTRDAEFDLQDAPVQTLAVSERSRLLFLAHSQGFCVAKTKDAIELAKHFKENGEPCSLQEISVVDVSIGQVSILALSMDSSTLAACVGGDVFFFSVASLLNKVPLSDDKEQEPCSSCSIGESNYVKDFKWKCKSGNAYVVLSGHGKLYSGQDWGPLMDMLDNVDAVEWSMKGDQVVAAKQASLIFLSYEFKEQFRMSVFQSWVDDGDLQGSVKVDSIKWARPDSIIVGCVQVNEDGVGEGYLIQVIIDRKSAFSEASCKPVVLSFTDLFPCIIDDVVSGRGPYLFTCYLERWELALVANRKNAEQHIVSLGWSLGDIQGEAVMVEFSQDKDLPRIELAENGDDNLVLGFGIDRVSLYEQIEVIKNAEEHIKLTPYCILACLTSDGRLVLFHVAKTTETSFPPQVASLPPSNTSSSSIMPLEGELTKGTPRIKNLEEQDVVSDAQLRQKDEEALQKDSDVTQQKGPSQVNEGKSLTSLVVQGSNLEKVPTSSLTENLGSAFRDLTKREARALVLSGNMSTDSSSQSQPSSGVVLKTDDISKGYIGGIGPKGVHGASPVLPSTGNFLHRTDYGAKSVPLATNGSSKSEVLVINQAISNNVFMYDNGENVSDITARTSIQSSTKSNASTTSSMSSRITPGEDRRMASMEPSKVVPGSAMHTSSTDKFLGSKGSNLLMDQRSLRSSGEPELSKRFRNVNDMVKELDKLLSHIEGDGGFREMCTVFQENSVLDLEEGLKKLSDRCRTWKNSVDAQVGDIRQLTEKTLQGLVKQASDKQYWELWNHQKLSSEFEKKQQHIETLHQTLMNQLTELERHFNMLELKKFGETESVGMNRRTPRRSLDSSREVQSLRSLYNTLNSQLAVAEDLSECLSKQMTVLKIESPQDRRKNVTKELFESIGLTYDSADTFQSPLTKKLGCAPDSSKKLMSFSRTITKEPPRRNLASALKGPEPETSRRRRDSLDMSWTNFEPQRTTVKRMLVEKGSLGRENKPLFRNVQDIFNSKMLENFDIGQVEINEESSSSVTMPSLKEEVNLISESKELMKLKAQSSEAPSTGLFKWAKDQTGASQIGIRKSLPMEEVPEFHVPSLSQSTISAGEKSGLTVSPSTHPSHAVHSDLSTSKTAAISEIKPALNTVSPFFNKTPTKIPSVTSSVRALVPENAVHVRPEASGTSTIRSKENFLASPPSFAPSGLDNKTSVEDVHRSEGLPGGTVSAPTSTAIVSAPTSTPVLLSTQVAPSVLPLRSSPATHESAGPLFSASGTSTISFKGSLSTPLGKDANGTTPTTVSSTIPLLSSKIPALVSSAAFFSSPVSSFSPFSSSSSSSSTSTAAPSSSTITRTVAASSSSSTTTTTPAAAAAAAAATATMTVTTPSSLSTLHSQVSKVSSPIQLHTGYVESKGPLLQTATDLPPHSKPASAVTLETMVGGTPLSVSPQLDSTSLANVSSASSSKPLTPLETGSKQQVGSSGPHMSEAVFGSLLGSKPSFARISSGPSIFGNATGASVSQPVATSSFQAVFQNAPSNTSREVKNETQEISEEDDMEEEASDTSSLNLTAIGGFGLGSAPAPNVPKTNPFGGPINYFASSPTTTFSLSASSGELFRPASFSAPSLSPPRSPQTMSQVGFSGGFGFSTSSTSSVSGFGQPAQIGAGQQALGSVLGSFGQSRQLGPGLPGVGFASSNNFAGSGFASAATGGGFSSLASSAAGFGALASGGGGGFSAASPSGGMGFAAAAAASGSMGFASAASAPSLGGFGAFGSKPGSGFSSLGGDNRLATGKPPELFTQIRK